MFQRVDSKMDVVAAVVDVVVVVVALAGAENAAAEDGRIHDSSKWELEEEDEEAQ